MPSLKLSFWFLACSALQARVLYVDPNLGSDCPSSYSVALRSCSGVDGPAFTKTASAIAAMQPGDTVFVRGGTYREPIIINKSGSANARLVITAQPGERVVVDTGATPGAIGIWIQGQAYVDVSGFVVRNAPIYGVKGTGSSNVTVQNIEVAFSGNGGIIFDNASNIRVSHCSVHHSNQRGDMMESISFEMVSGFEVSDCRVFNNRKDGIVSKYGSTNGKIFSNDLYRNQGCNIYLDATSNIAVFNNISHDVAGQTKAGIGIAVESTYNLTRSPTHDLQIYNNVLYGNGSAIWFWFESPSLTWSRFSNIRIEHNTIEGNTLNGWGGIFIMNGTMSNFGPGNTIRNNIFWNNTAQLGAKSIRDDTGVVGSFTISNNFFQQLAPSTTFGVQSIVSPQSPFVDVAAHDYRLVGTALARNAGASLSGITEDIDGKPRPSSRPDLGAFQY